MNRALEYLSIAGTNTPQPVFSTTVATAFVPSTDGLGQPVPSQSLLVADASLFKKNDLIIVVETDGSLSEISIRVTAVDTGTNTLTVQGLSKAHAVGAWVILNANCTSVYIQFEDGSTGDYGVGVSKDLDFTTGVDLISVIRKIAATLQPPDWSSSNIYGANPASTAEYWIIGTATDRYLPSFIKT